MLQQNELTEADADQLRALAILGGEIDGRAVRLPWLENVELLVLDGFFDFTPVQGEMLRQLIHRIPNVLVNLNNDHRNPGIFEPFSTTIEQLKSIADFKEERSDEAEPAKGALTGLREQLFKPGGKSSIATEAASTQEQQDVRLLTCADRETEIRKIAKEIKRLVTQENYPLGDIALVVRERASYADTVTRVMKDEEIACDLDRRINVIEIPAIKAARKVFEMLDGLARAEKSDVKISDLADLIKSEYVRLSEDELSELNKTFEQNFGALLSIGENTNGVTDANARRERMKYVLGVGRWDPDSLENTVAFVGGALSLTSWLERARRLLGNWQQVKATTDLVVPETAEGVSDEESDQIEDADKVATDDRGVEKKRRPSRDVASRGNCLGGPGARTHEPHH